MRTNIYKNKIVALLKNNHLLSIADIHTKIKGADYSTIYRNVEQLVAAGTIKRVVLGKDTVMYEMANEHDQHDHFVCTNCGLVDEVEQLSRPLPIGKYVITDVLFRGVCHKCR
ncbi:transcriptional repressor [Patescibacteria group bacterium]|nr:transcriptional repressor [Patescibacteria group bacterium]